MKDQHHMFRRFGILNILLALILFLPGSLFSQRYQPTEKDWTKFDANSISAWVTSYGNLFRNPMNGNSGFEWPRGGGVYAIYATGLWVGALVDGEPRVATTEYNYDLRPGTIDNATHTPNDPADTRFRIYKIQKGITDSWDYQHWPYADGAPLDENGDPLFMEDQTLWTVYNDADTSQHINFESLPLGIEVQQTVFGDLRFSTSNDFLFIRWLVINKGKNLLDSVYLCIWSDVDLGDSGDDFVGCDTTLSLGYCYNAYDHDSEYGSHPPAVGFQVLQGPIVDSPGDSGIYIGRKVQGSQNKKMTSFVRYISANILNGTPRTAQDVWYYMQSIWRNGQHMTYGGYGGTDPNNPKTNYLFSGDPETGTGWLDSAPADRTFMISSGPFDLAPGDSNEIVVAAIIARGSSNLNSVTELKRIVSLLQTEYNSSFYKRLRYYNEKPAPPITHIRLFQNYPNPFNSQTTITYELPINREVKLEIYNIRGQRVATIVDERQEPNSYTYTWDASGLASGVYFASLRVAQYQLTRKLLLLK